MAKRSLFLLILIATLSLRCNNISSSKSGSVIVSSSEGIVNGKKGKKLHKYFTSLEKKGFSCSVLMSWQGTTYLKKNYGFADKKRRIPVGDRTVFYLGSVSKHFASAAILKLESQDKLNTKDLISKHLDGVPEDKKAITIHHLLTHTSGLISMYGSYSEVVTIEEAIKKTMATRLKFTPGQQLSYSNIGYNMVAAIIEKVSGKPFVEYLKEEIFDPAGMVNTGTVYNRTRWSADHIACGYIDRRDYGKPTEWTTWKRMGAGGIISCVEDLYNWSEALEGNNVLSREEKKKLFTPYWGNYGYGLVVNNKLKGYRAIYHEGILNGFGTFFAIFPEEDGLLIFLSNTSGDPTNTVMKALEILVRE